MAFTDAAAPEPEVLLGIYPSPVADDPAHVVDLTRIAEGAGLDLVVVQDHPYQPAFLDGLTTAAAVAAGTTSVHVLPHVAALPLRLPVTVARAVASLDLASGGRSGVVLSAGDFTEGIIAAGGPALAPEESARALGRRRTSSGRCGRVTGSWR